MNCTELRTLIDMLPFGEWAAPQLEFAERHAHTCRTCRESLARAKALESALENLWDPEPPARLTSAVMARLRSSEPPAATGRTPQVQRWQSSRKVGWQVPGLAVTAVTSLAAYLGRLLAGDVALNLMPLHITGWLELLDASIMLDPVEIAVAAGATAYLALLLTVDSDVRKTEEP